MDSTVQTRKPRRHQDLDARRVEIPPSRAAYILAVTGALAAVTFTLVYLAAYSFTLNY